MGGRGKLREKLYDKLSPKESLRSGRGGRGRGVVRGGVGERRKSGILLFFFLFWFSFFSFLSECLSLFLFLSLSPPLSSFLSRVIRYERSVELDQVLGVLDNPELKTTSRRRNALAANQGNFIRYFFIFID